MARKAIPIKIQLAAALLQLVDEKGDRLIPHRDAELMTSGQIVSLFELDHYPRRVADGGTDEPHNLTWRLRAEHKRKTATIDQPQIAKQRRIRAREQKHRESMEYKSGIMAAGFYEGPEWESPQERKIMGRHKIPSRPFPKGRKFANRK